MRIQSKIEQEKMWKKISEFNLDNPTSSFVFSARLAKENGWSREYAKRVIEEYKKFLYLSVISGKSLTPSEEVDQAWHLHMIYTHSYWNDLCKETLGVSLHHGPTKGGRKETEKYTDQYQFTLDLYESQLGQKAPKDIWPDTKTRFENIHYQRVNMKESIVLNKAKVKKHMLSYALAIIAFFACSTLMSASGETNSDFSVIMMWFLGGIVTFFIINAIYRYVTKSSRSSNYSKNDIGYYSSKQNKSSSSRSSSSSSSSSTSSNKSSSSSDTNYGTGCTIAGSAFGCGSDSGHGHGDGGHGGDSGGDGGSGCGSSGCGSSGCGGGGCGGGCGS